MRVLFDCIYSSFPRRCSSAYKFRLLAEHLLSTYPDCFIYWRWPEWATVEDLAWLAEIEAVHGGKQSRITPLPVKHPRANRVHEYDLVPPDLHEQIWAFGKYWDTDVIVTMRTPQVASILLQTLTVRMRAKNPPRSVICLEEMAMLSSRLTALAKKTLYQDVSTLLGYLSADLTLITANHVRTQAMQLSRQYFSPSQVREIDKRLALVSPIELPAFHTKTPKDFPTKRKPNILFSGRMAKSASNLETLFKAVTTTWVLSGDEPPDFTVSSISEASKIAPPEFSNEVKNNRDQFHKLLKTGVDVGIYMPLDAEFSLTAIEPICFGVPLVLIRKDWSEALLGKDYPFFVSNEAEAHAWLKAILGDYAKHYATFLKWRKEVFAHRFGPEGVYGHTMIEVLFYYFQRVAERHLETSTKDGDIAHAVAQHVVSGEPFHLDAILAKAAEAGDISEPPEPKVWHNVEIPAGFKIEKATLRLALKKLTGAVDYGPEPGWMVVPKNG